MTQERSDDEIAAVRIGGPGPTYEKIVLVDYDPEWPRRFARDAAAIHAALGERALQLEHIGSTSVPGLAAKPIIDMLLVVADSADEPAYVPPLEQLGYLLRIREPDWHEHRLLKGPERTSNLHVVSRDCTEIARWLRFRDHLRGNAADRELYLATKRELAARDWKYTQHYADAKSDVVEEILRRAESVANSRA